MRTWRTTSRTSSPTRRTTGPSRRRSATRGPRCAHKRKRTRRRRKRRIRRRSCDQGSVFRIYHLLCRYFCCSGRWVSKTMNVVTRNSKYVEFYSLDSACVRNLFFECTFGKLREICGRRLGASFGASVCKGRRVGMGSKNFMRVRVEFEFWGCEFESSRVWGCEFKSSLDYAS